MLVTPQLHVERRVAHEVRVQEEVDVRIVAIDGFLLQAQSRECVFELREISRVLRALVVEHFVEVDSFG